MAGVDKGDQLRQYYRVRTKCRKKYKYIFWFLFDVVITNSYLSLFAPTTMPNRRLKAFRLRLADQLVGNYNSRKCLGRPCSRSAHPPPTIPPLHHLGPLPAQATRTALHLPSRQKNKRRCVYSSQYRDSPQRHDVLWQCKVCPGQPPLCFTGNEDDSDCFRLWHAHLLYNIVTYSHLSLPLPALVFLPLPHPSPTLPYLILPSLPLLLPFTLPSLSLSFLILYFCCYIYVSFCTRS